MGVNETEMERGKERKEEVLEREREREMGGLYHPVTLCSPGHAGPWAAVPPSSN